MIMTFDLPTQSSLLLHDRKMTREAIFNFVISYLLVQSRNPVLITYLTV